MLGGWLRPLFVICKWRQCVLSPYRILDLTTERGLWWCADSWRPGSRRYQNRTAWRSARRLGPFYRDVPDANRSLYWWAYNRNKRSITLNLETNEGKAILRRLVPGAHFLIESDNPGAMTEKGLSYTDLENSIQVWCTFLSLRWDRMVPRPATLTAIW